MVANREPFVIPSVVSSNSKSLRLWQGLPGAHTNFSPPTQPPTWPSRDPDVPAEYMATENKTVSPATLIPGCEDETDFCQLRSLNSTDPAGMFPLAPCVTSFLWPAPWAWCWTPNPPPHVCSFLRQPWLSSYQLPLLKQRPPEVQFSSVQFSHSVVSDSFRPHESQHTRPPCPSPTPGVHPNPSPWSRWCHQTISSSVVPFSSRPQSFPASGSFPMSQFFAWGGLQKTRGQLWSSSACSNQTKDGQWGLWWKYVFRKIQLLQESGCKDTRRRNLQNTDYSRGEEVDRAKRIDMENRDCGANIQILIVTQKESK